jgi:hypothetical protein
MKVPPIYRGEKQTIKTALARHWWLTSVILATQEAEIRRIAIQRKPGQIVLGDPVLKKPSTKRAGGVAQVVGP